MLTSDLLATPLALVAFEPHGKPSPETPRLRAEPQDPATHFEGIRNLESHLDPATLHVPELLRPMPQPVSDVPGEVAREDNAHGDYVNLDDPPGTCQGLLNIILQRGQ